MSTLSKLSPLRAIRDLRAFMAQRSRVELWFAVLAVGFTGLILAGFVHDSKMTKPYKREIVYAESWPATRTDAEIIAQQKIDKVEKDKRLAEIERLRKERQAAFKRLDDKLEAWGL